LDKNKNTILIVDDENSIVNSLTRLLRREGFHTISAASGHEGLELLKNMETPVALIISDQRMPEMTGDQFLEEAKELAPQALRFLLTGHADMDALIAAINKGQVHRYIAKPWNDKDFVIQVGQAIELFNLVQENKSLQELTQRQNQELLSLNRQLEKKVTERGRVLLKAHEELKTTLLDGFRLIISVVEMLNPSFGEYLNHVSVLSERVGREMGLDKDMRSQIKLAGMFHDIGLIGMPESLLIKDKTEMDPDEYQLYVQHPYLIAICFESTPQLAQISKIIISHHENIDGSGYPNGLKGEEIPIGSRIIKAVSDYCRIVDTWPTDPSKIHQEATKRYGSDIMGQLTATESEALLKEVATAILIKGSGSRYDVTVVETFERVLSALQSEPQKKTKLVINDLKEGMILAEAIVLKDGESIMNKGIRLNQRLIGSLEKLLSYGRVLDQISVFTEDNVS
jgi:response regulator RpfG family c-di-GMP phosphodiesterase